MDEASQNIQLRQRLNNEFGEVQSAQILDLFCNTVGVELDKVRNSAEAENQRKLMHNSRGLRSVCQSVFVYEMALTCSEIEAAAEKLDWALIDKLLARLDSEFESVRNQHQ